MSNHATYGIVYVVTNTVNGKQYVGQTTQALAKRWAGHTSRSNKQCRALWNAIQKYGAGAFTLATVDSGTDKDDLDAKETEWVSRLGTVSPAGYNLTTGGGSSGKPSPETIELRRMALLGHTTSQETRDLIRAAQVGRPLTHEHRDALARFLDVDAVVVAVELDAQHLGDQPAPACTVEHRRAGG